MKHILFVDDEKNILNGIKRVLRPMHHQWSIAFSNDGEEALAMFEQQNFDVIVSDMRMPGMNGVELLQEVKNRYPETIRIGLSGHTDNTLALASTRTTHQQLVKPCEPDKLKNTIKSALQLRERINNKDLSALISQADSLPSHPKIYDEIVLAAQSPNSSLNDIATIISRDIAMSAKILQLVNSAFFGLARHIPSVTEAVSLLGVDVVKALILNIKLFKHYEQSGAADGSLQSLQQKSLEISAFARKVAISEGATKHICDYAQMAGVLHDSGMLVLKTSFREKYQKVDALSLEESIPLWDAEKRIFNCTHMDISAYLLGLWGLPQQIIDAVAHHHQPSHSKTTTFGPLAAVHIADSMISEARGASDLESRLDLEFISTLGLSGKIPLWHELLTTPESNDEQKK